MHPQTVECKLCGKPTEFTGTRLCVMCWEVNRHIEDSPNLTTVYRSLYNKLTSSNTFKHARGICTCPTLTDEYNTQVIQTVILAHLLGIKIQAARVGTIDWEDITDVPTDFVNFQFRKAL